MSFPTPPPVKPPRFKMAPLHLATRYTPAGVAVVAVAGEIDMATAPALQAALMHALALHTPDGLDVDLSACTFMDCAGLQVLLAVRTAASAAGCQTWVSHPPHMVHLVLQVTNLLEIFTSPTGQPAQQQLGLHRTGQAAPAARAAAA